MYATSKNSIQQQSLISQICIICLHLTQRFMTIRFFAGLCTGIILTIIIYHGKEPIDKPKFRPDQSKFEYEKNQLLSEEIDLSKTPTWNNSWDRYDSLFFKEKFFKEKFFSSLKKESTWARHLYLIRHGQYFDNARTLNEMKLTILGKEQLEYTGKRLNQMNIQFDRLIHSGMVRALESAIIINEQLDSKLQLIEDKNLTEGLPVAPVPYAGISQRDVDVRRIK
jgi:hypothetical protein